MANLTRTLAVLLFSVALVLGILAVMLAREPAPAPERGRTPTHSSAAVAPQRLVPVVVAARDLPAGKPLDAESLSVRMQADAEPGAFSDTAALIGRVPIEVVRKGTPLAAGALSSGLSDVLAPGERAVAVRIDETNAVGNFVRPGDYVDVFFTLKREGAAGGDAEVTATQARLLLSKVRVLSMGDASIVSGADERKNATPGAAQNIPRTAVLALRTADVDALTLAEGVGRVVLALRNAVDDETAPPHAFVPLHAAASSTSSTDSGAARAAAGLSLATLAGGRVAARADGRFVARAENKPRGPRAPSGGEVEVIRAGRAERVAY